MKLTAPEVMKMYQRDMQGFPWDEELLQTVIDSFDYTPSMDTILYRFSDVINGVTKIMGTDVILTSKSAVTELPISYEMYQKVTRAGILTIEDINLERCTQVLTFEDYAELTAAVLTLGV